MSDARAPNRTVTPPLPRARTPHHSLRRALLMCVVLAAPVVSTTRMAPGDLVPARPPARNTARAPVPGVRLGILTSGSSTEVTGVLSSSPAEVAGVRPGDVVVCLGGQRVDHPRELARLLQDRPAGGVVVLGLRRAGEALELPVTLAPGPPGSRDAASAPSR